MFTGRGHQGQGGGGLGEMPRARCLHAGYMGSEMSRVAGEERRISGEENRGGESERRRVTQPGRRRMRRKRVQRGETKDGKGSVEGGWGEGTRKRD